MKSILEYQNEYWLNQSLINESFKSSILKEISSQLNDRIKANAETNISDRHASKDTSSNFKYVFDRNYFVAWDKVTDDMFKEYDGKSDEAIKLAKQMISNRSTSFPGMVILINDYEGDGPKYLGCIVGTTSWPGYISFSSNWTINANDIRPSEIPELLTKKVLIANFKDKDVMTGDLKDKRNDSKRNALAIWKETRDYDYGEILKRNKERYKQYVAKVKAQKDADDGIADKVNEYVNKVLAITTKLSKNPTKYAKLEYEVGYLLDLLNDKRKYVNGYGRQQGYYSGTNGLLTVFRTYMTTKLSQSKGDSYEHEKQEYEASKKALQQIFDTIDKKLEKFAEVE